MKHKHLFALVGFMLLAFMLTACGGSDEPEWRVFFTNIKDGDTVSSPVTVQWSAENFTIEPAGEVKDGAGHLHVMIDVPCVTAGEAVPADDNHRHFGMAQTETLLELSPGEHTLCLQAADGVHTALDGDGATEVIDITVE
jgi:hypothetical protein